MNSSENQPTKYEEKMTEFFKKNHFISTDSTDIGDVINIEKLAETVLSEGSYSWINTVGEMMDEIAGDPNRFNLRIEAIA